MRVKAVLTVDGYGLQAAALGSERHGALQPQLKLCEGAKWIVLAPELQTRGTFASCRETCQAVCDSNHLEVLQHEETCMHQARYGMCSQSGNKPCPAMRKAGRCHLISPARLTGCLLRLRLLQLQTVQQCCAEGRCPRASGLACQLS